MKINEAGDEGRVKNFIISRKMKLLLLLQCALIDVGIGVYLFTNQLSFQHLFPLLNIIKFEIELGIWKREELKKYLIINYYYYYSFFFLFSLFLKFLY